MSLWTLYLITILPNVGGFFIKMPMIIMAIFSLGVVSCNINQEDEKARKWRSSLKKISFFAIPLIFLGVLIPTQNQMYLIVGGYAATNVEGINKLPANLVGAANAYLEKIAKEVEPEKEKK